MNGIMFTNICESKYLWIKIHFAAKLRDIEENIMTFENYMRIVNYINLLALSLNLILWNLELFIELTTSGILTF
jgi:hypothetical protein